MEENTFEIRTDHNVTTADRGTMVTPDDIYGLHDWPEKLVDGRRIGDPIRVAVMDSGIDQRAVKNHPWLDGTRVVERFDATGTDDARDAVGHGTGVASLIAKLTSKVQLIDVRIFGENARTGPPITKKAYHWLINNSDEIDVVNMSWGSGEDYPFINNLHEKLMDLGIFDVVAAGNSGGSAGSPATAPKAFSVGALNEEGDPTRFSSFNPDKGNPDVAALGKDVKMARAPGTSMGTPLNEDFVKASGTSFSAPITSAAYVNALYQERVSWDQRFMRSAPDIPGTPKDGGGVLKLNSTLVESEGNTNDNTVNKDDEDNSKTTTKTDASSWNFKGNDTVWIDADWLPHGAITAERLNETKEYVDIRFHHK